MTKPYDPYNPHAQLTDLESRIEGDLDYGFDLITRVLPRPVSYSHFKENLLAGIHYLTRAAETMGCDMSAPFPDQDENLGLPEWDLDEVWQVVYRSNTEPVAESRLGELLVALRNERKRDSESNQARAMRQAGELDT